ncbi:hypothetical protein P5V15_002434 [Pogonomyrmex californicus]
MSHDPTRISVNTRLGGFNRYFEFRAPTRERRERERVPLSKSGRIRPSHGSRSDDDRRFHKKKKNLVSIIVMPQGNKHCKKTVYVNFNKDLINLGSHKIITRVNSSASQASVSETNKIRI